MVNNKIIFIIIAAIGIFAGCEENFPKKTSTRGKIGACYSPVMKGDSTGIYVTCNYFGNIYFYKSSDDGAKWTRTEIGSTANVDGFSSIYVNSTNIYITYYETNSKAILFASSSDRGATWSSPVTVDPLTSYGFYNSIAATGSAIIISYYDSTNSDLKIAMSANGGISWSASTIDSTNYVGRYSWAAADDSGNFHVSYWYGTGNAAQTNIPVLKTAMSTDSGVTWTTNAVSHPSSLCYGLYASMAAQANNVYVVYFDAKTYTFNAGTNTFTVPSTGTMGFVKSSDSGATWSAPVDVADYKTGSLDRFGIAADGNNLYIAYWDLDQKNLKIAVSTDAGSSWASEVIDPNINGSLPKHPAAQIAVVNNKIYVAYEADNYYIYFASSIDGGKTWNW